MNHPKDRSKLEIASGAAIRAFQTTVWRQKLQTDEVKEGKGWERPQGTRPAASHTSAALQDGCSGKSFWVASGFSIEGEGSRQARSPGSCQPGGRLRLRVPGLVSRQHPMPLVFPTGSLC